MVIRRFVLTLVASLGLIHGVPADAVTGAPDAVPLSVAAGGLISLDARINGAGPFRLMLDTGSSASSVSRKLMRTLQLGIVASTDLVTPSGTRARDVVRIDVLSVGKASGQGLLATVLEDRDFAALGANVDGIIGQDFLAHQQYTLDYRRNLLTWGADAGGEGPAGVNLDLKREDGRWLVALPQDAAGRVLWFVPDSGAAALVLFDRGSAPALRIRSVACCAAIATVNGSGDARVAVVHEFRVGSRVLRNQSAVIVDRPDAHAPAGDGLLPLSMFARVSFQPGQHVLRVRF